MSITLPCCEPEITHRGLSHKTVLIQALSERVCSRASVWITQSARLLTTRSFFVCIRKRIINGRTHSRIEHPQNTSKYVTAITTLLSKSHTKHNSILSQFYCPKLLKTDQKSRRHLTKLKRCLKFDNERASL